MSMDFTSHNMSPALSRTQQKAGSWRALRRRRDDPRQLLQLAGICNQLRDMRFGVCERNHSSGYKDAWEDRLAKRSTRGWRAVSVAGLQDQGLRKRIIFSRHRSQVDGRSSTPFFA